MRYLAILLLVSVGLSRASAQDDLDFSDLDKVEKEEFGDQETPKDESADFDLENPSKPAQDATDAQGDLEKELDTLDDKQTEVPKDSTVDLDKELEQEDTPQEVAPAQPTPEAAPEALPPLEAPKEETVEETPPPPEPPVEQVQEPAPVPAPEVSITDEPNQKLEERLSRIYQKFMSSRTTDEEWLQIAGDKASETYTVQVGDTLWDISVTFFGNGHFWPKLWQLNDTITNPHVIVPGRVIKFSPGTLEQPPRIDIADGEAPPPEAVAVATPEAEAAEPQPEIPPAKPFTPALKQIPPSLPPLVFEGEGQYDADGFSINKQAANITDPPISLTNYLAEEVPDGVGEIAGVEQMGAETAGTWQYVFVRLDSARLGESLTVYSPGPKVEFESDKYGTAVDYQGVVQIISRASDDEPLYRAMVTSALGQVRIGSRVSRDPIPRIVIDANGKSNSAHGNIVGGHFSGERKVLGLNSVVYLDIGQNQGVSVGDVMTVLRNEIRHNPKGVVKGATQPIGKLKIAKTTPTRATAILIDSSDAILPGDVVGSVSNNSLETPSGEDVPAEEPEDLEE